MASPIWKKRRTALLQIALLAGGNVAITAAPKPTVEVPTSIALTGADFVMCAMIHQIYFGEEIDKTAVIDTLGAAGLLVVVAGAGGYALAKTTNGLIAEFTNILGPLGWMASGLLAAGGTAILGLSWMFICDYAFRNRISLKKAASSLA